MSKVKEKESEEKTGSVGIFFRLTIEQKEMFYSAVENLSPKLSAGEVFRLFAERFIRMAPSERDNWIAQKDNYLSTLDEVLLTALWTEHAFSSKHFGWLAEGSLDLRDITKNLPSIREYADYRVGYALLALCTKLRIEGSKNSSAESLELAIQCGKHGIIANKSGVLNGKMHPVFHYNIACGYSLIASATIEKILLSKGILLNEASADPYRTDAIGKWRSLGVTDSTVRYVESLLNTGLGSLTAVQTSAKPPKDISFLVMKSAEDPDMSLLRNDPCVSRRYTEWYKQRVTGNALIEHVKTILKELPTETADLSSFPVEPSETTP